MFPSLFTTKTYLEDPFRCLARVVKPHIGLHRIFAHPFAPAVHDAQGKLSLGLSLFGVRFNTLLDRLGNYAESLGIPLLVPETVFLELVPGRQESCGRFKNDIGSPCRVLR